MKLIEQDEPLQRIPVNAEAEDPFPLPRGRRTIPINQKRLQDRVLHSPPRGLRRDELEAHFRGMPPWYWDNVTRAELIWGLETVHAFLAKLMAWETPGAPAVASLRHCPERGFTQVMVCTLDRPGLLAKIAATFSVLRINILQADIYTRTDNVVLDVFRVSGMNDARPIDAERLEQLIFMLEGALNDPPRLVSVWARQFQKAAAPAAEAPVALAFDNLTSEANTILRVEAPDRLGLLSSVLEALHQCSVNVAQAVVSTEGGVARDLFYITDREGAKIQHKLALGTIRKVVAEALRSKPN
jgi:[protein-PII] uridylyltransferase